MKTASEIRAWLTEQISGILSLPEEEISPDETFDSFGLASRDAVSLSGDLEDYLGLRLSPTLLYQYPSIQQLADHLAETEARAHAATLAAANDEQKTAAYEDILEASTPRAHSFQPRRAAEPSVPAEIGTPAHEPIAIVGLACRFPGADSAGEFWKLLAEGRDAISAVPESRWDREGLYNAQVGATGKMNTRWGGFLSDVAHWDAHFFGVSPREASRMDPQQRLLLETAWEALEDAGIPADQVAGSNTGVFVGVSSNDYSRLQTGVPEHIDAYIGTGNALSIAANRISFFFDFRGPSLAVDTACSSSLVSVHLACSSLATGECNLALAAGVNVILAPEVTISFSHAHMMAADGRCKTFDAAADGYVRGEGVGVVALKRLADAEAAGDQILAVIRGSAVKQDGRSNGLTAPNPKSQEAVITQALANAGVLPSQVSYVEAHGTGTALGDPIELRALAAALAPGRPANHKAAIASVKTNFGHLESAAGVASLIKVVLMLQHEQIPPSLHFQQPNPHIPFDFLPVAVQTHLGPWEAPPGLPRIAGISSFGFGGTNAHLIVSEFRRPADGEKISSALDCLIEGPNPDQPFLLPISARSAAALSLQARAWSEFLSTTDACVWGLANSAATRRSHHDYRLAVVGATREEWRGRLAAFLNDESALGLATGHQRAGSVHRVALAYSGQGAQWAGMGRELLAAERVFSAKVEAVDELWKRLAGWSVAGALHSGERLDETAVAQPAIFALQVGMTALLQSWGLAVEGVTGHSVGEIAAAYVGGILSLEDAVRVLYHRSRLMQAATGLGKMAVVGVSEAEARALIKEFPDKLSVAAINSPHLVTLSGDAGALDMAVETAQARGVFCRMLPVNYAFHSFQMEPFLDELRDALNGIELRPAKLVVFSTVTGRRASTADYGADYWPSNVRQTVRFVDAIRGFASEGFDAFVDVAPHSGMVRSIAECLPNEDGYTVVGSLQRGKPERAMLLSAAGQLYCAGVAPAWPTSNGAVRRVDIPHYAWDRQYYWSQVQTELGMAPASIAARIPAAAGAGHPLLGRQVKSPALQAVVFEQTVGTHNLAYLADHRIGGMAVLPAAGYLEMFLAAGRLALGKGRVVVEDVNLARVLPLGGSGRTIHIVVGGQDAQVFSSEDGNDWTIHASASVREEVPSSEPATLALRTIQERCTSAMPPAEFYRDLAAHGLEYGPAFRGVDGLWRGAHESLGHIALPADLMTDAYILHPALLDACFQLVAAALTKGEDKGPDYVYLPVAVHSLRVAAGLSGTRKAWAHVKIRQPEPDTDEPAGGDLEAELLIATEAGEPLANVEGLRVRPVLRKLVSAMIGVRESAAPEDVSGATLTGSEPIVAEWPERIEDAVYQLGWQEAPTLPAPEGLWAQGLWLLLVDESGVGARLGRVLESTGATTWLIHQQLSVPATEHVLAEPKWIAEGVCTVDGCSPGAVAALVAEAAATGLQLRGAVYLWGLDANPDDLGAVLPGALHLTQALAHTPVSPLDYPPRLWLVTTNGVATDTSEAPNPAQGSLWGFGNVAALEHPELRPVRIDTSPETSTGVLAAELAGLGQEDRVVLRDTRRLVARLRHSALPSSSLVAGAALSGSDGGSLRLEITERGSLENIARFPMTRVAPGESQVEIEVRAAGLNFRDIMNLLGLYPGDAGLLGGECAGVVTRVGPDVEQLKVGDRVMGIAPGCFGAYTTTYARLVTRIPDRMTFEEAATIPIAFLTAHFTLNRLGKMAAGDRVLIHAASGGVGLAGIQLARLAGAEVFATAGSPAKREFLQDLGLTHVMNSRNLAFSEETLAATGGRGVDLVLNSLSGDFIPRSLAALATTGRFLEIGKVGIWDSEQVGKVRPHAAYYIVALDELCATQPELIGEMLSELVPHFEAGRLQPLPITAYPVDQASDGFRLMAQTRHIGKVVITQDATASGTEQASGSSLEGTYLITGGTGAVGTLVAQRLIDLGARHLLLATVTVPGEASEKAVAQMEAAGARVVVAFADVSKAEEAAGLLAQIEEAGLPPLRGIVHAAGVLDDGVIVQQNWGRFERVLAPKAAGAWNLHCLTEDLPLDFFVLFSSVASLIGSPGQANYAAANAYMDGLAALRQASGRAGLSINWGPWAVGMAVAGNERDRRRREESGVAAIEPEQGLDAFARLILGGARGQRCVAPIAWERFALQFPPDNEPALLKEVMAETRRRGAEPRPVRSGATTRSAEQGGKTELVTRLEAAMPRERMPILVDFIVARTLKILGLEPNYPLDTRKPMNEMGLDSLMAVELKNALDAGLGRKLATTLVFEHPSIHAMGRYLLEGILALPTADDVEKPKVAAELAPVRPAEPRSAQTIAAMSEEEVEAALLQKLRELDG